jgi:hypothetical protein
MERSSSFLKLQELIVSDKKLLFTTVSCVMILIIFMNLKLTLSPVIGTSASIVYFLLLIVLLALVAWAVMIIYNLDTIMSAFVLCVVTAVCSFLNKMTK